MTTTGTAEVDGHRDDAEGAAEASARLRRGRLVTAVVVGALVLVVGVVALLGGFGARKDQFHPVAVGSVIATGPYEVSVEKATARRHGNDDGWSVEVSGTARTTGDASIDPGIPDEGFVFARSESTREVQSSATVTLGAASSPVFSIDYLTPGLPPVPWTVSFTFDRPPGDELLVVVFDQDYTTTSLFGDEMGWRPGSTGSTLTLPVEQLPD